MGTQNFLSDQETGVCFKIDLIDSAKKRLDCLKQLYDECCQALEKMPEGSLRISSKSKSGKVMYYHRRTKSERYGKYIPLSRMELVSALIQKEYYVSTLSDIGQEIRQLEKIITFYEKACKKDVKNQKSGPRSMLLSRTSDLLNDFNCLSEFALSEDEYAYRWINQPFEAKPFEDGQRFFSTRRGEKVRSKSELIIADCLDEAGIDYKYECPLNMKKYIIHPDFTILDRRRRKIIYWEHLGMMDDPAYAEKAILRIKAYADNNIYEGDRLILSFESANAQIDTAQIRSIIAKHLH